MIWVTWRQQRTETLIAALLLVFVAALIVPTGLHMASVYDSEAVAACLSADTEACRQTLGSFSGRWDSLMNFVGWLNLVPVLLGALIAAPLVLEFERGTFRLAWTQSVSRDRWLATRVALVVAASLATGLFFALLMTWWRDPLDDVNGRFSDAFGLEGVVPLASTLFAAALVLALGVALRRAAAAIGLAFIVFLALRIGIGNWARPNYQDRIEATWTGDARPSDLAGAWVFREGGEFRVTDGQPPDPSVVQGCIGDPAIKSFDEACLAEHGIRALSFASYHPADRFWTFQAIEAGIFVAMALALLAFSIWWIRQEDQLSRRAPTRRGTTIARCPSSPAERSPSCSPTWRTRRSFSSASVTTTATS